MTSIGSLAALVLAAVFAWSAAAKCVMGRQWPDAFVRLELPRRLAWPLVGFEVTLVGGLLVDVVRRPAAAVAAVTLVIMSLVLIERLRRGVRPPCACFGAAGKRPLSWREPVRNFLLLAVALVAILS